MARTPDHSSIKSPTPICKERWCFHGPLQDLCDSLKILSRCSASPPPDLLLCVGVTVAASICVLLSVLSRCSAGPPPDLLLRFGVTVAASICVFASIYVFCVLRASPGRELPDKACVWPGTGLGTGLTWLGLALGLRRGAVWQQRPDFCRAPAQSERARKRAPKVTSNL